MKKYLFILIMALGLNVNAFAGTVEFFHEYSSGDEVNYLRLNGNIRNILNEMNGGIDNVNIDDTFSLTEILGALPVAGQEGRCVYLTTTNTLHFDDGSDWVEVPTYSGSAVSGDIMYFNGTVWARLAKGTTGNTLYQGASYPDWGALNLAGGANYITGELPSANGGNILYSTQVVAASNSVDATRADQICDGTADDVQINAAIAACTVGGRVILLEGTYNIAATVDLDVNDITLEGQGWNTILKAITNLNDEVVRCTVDRAMLKNVYIENSTNAQSSLASCVEFAGADHCTIDTVKISGRCLTGAWPLDVADCDFLKLTNSTVVVSTGGISGEGICLTMSGGSLYIIVKGNIFDGTACTVNNSALIGGNSSTSGYGWCVISENIFIGDDAEADFGINLENHADYSNNCITGNVFKDIATYFVTLIGANASKNLITGNMAENNIEDNGTSTFYRTATDSDPLNVIQ